MDSQTEWQETSTRYSHGQRPRLVQQAVSQVLSKRAMIPHFQTTATVFAPSAMPIRHSAKQETKYQMARIV
ncbi:hypothetical protein [Gelidibacter maritimus]|uniref:hypothetical protein n=1 Tax=Gelidibacter maritimus TaxID=2761487 RepID=UPI001C71311D|nr:hypothetical protein [Gelidibacter maritimus]